MAQGDVNVRMFGVLDGMCKEQGRPSRVTVSVPEEGISAEELAEQLELPLDQIEGVFCNHTVYGVDRIIRPGDEVAFVPYGTPGPHRFYLGLYRAGKSSNPE
ncbi:MAG: MoaD/ThiS family protein [Coriobacteriia bacterium]|nr:MoaD/ThiS family protein [Coriobacteriia bacterium]MBN2822851.1 MoaD/ThiS family protein [Coriobacteriia bacterium]